MISVFIDIEIVIRVISKDIKIVELVSNTIISLY